MTRWTQVDRQVLCQIAEAVEVQGGDFEDVEDLVDTWERMVRQLTLANAKAVAGDESAADAEYCRLDTEYGRPLADIARERIQTRHDSTQSINREAR